jgi:hypothetical protein
VDAVHADLTALEPGEAHDVSFAARPDVADEHTRDSRVQAELQMGELVLGSNVVGVRVIGRASFCPPASAVRVERLERDLFRVVAEIVNAGDALARDVQIDVPPPPGFVPDNATTSPLFADVPPGVTVGFAYTMRPLAPVSEQVATGDALVTFDATRSALLTSTAWALTPDIAPPVIEGRRTAERIDVIVRIRNDGWVPARDLSCLVAMPAAWRVVRGALLAGSAPVRSRRDPACPNGIAVTLPFIAARESIDVAIVACVARGADGPIVVRCAGHVVEWTIPPPMVRALQIDARVMSAFAPPGSVVAIAVDVMNAGETGETVTLAFDGVACWTQEVRAGSLARAVGRATIPADARAGEPWPLHISAVAGDGTVLAATTLGLHVLAQRMIAREEAPEDVASGAESVQLEAVLDVPENVASGARLDVRLRCVAKNAVAAIRIRHQPPDGAAYVAGSTTINGYAVVDDAARAPLDGAGLALHDLPADTEARITWSLLPRISGDLNLSVDIEANGTLLTTLARTVRVRVGPAFGIRPDALPFHIDAPTIDEPLDDPNRHAERGPKTSCEPAAIAEGGGVPFDSDIVFAGTDVFTDEHGDYAHGDAADITHGGGANIAHGGGANITHGGGGKIAHGDGAKIAHGDAGNITHAGGDNVTHSGGDNITQNHGVTRVVPLDDILLTFGLTRSAERDEQLRRVLHGSRSPGILGHLPAIAILFPDAVAVDDAAVEDAFAAAGDAVRSVFQKLFVKLRIPGYDLTVADLEDVAARRKLVAFLDAAITLQPKRPRDPDSTTVVRSLGRERTRSLRAKLGRVPIGSAAALEVIASFLPDDAGAVETERADASPDRALRNYGATFARALAAVDAPDDAAFMRAITTTPASALDAARDELLAALELQTTVESQAPKESPSAALAR